MEIKIEKLDKEETAKFSQLIRVFEEVFEIQNFTMPDENYLRQVLRKEDFFVFVAVIDNKVVGGSTSYILHQYYSASPLVYIYDLGVKREYQRKGIGKKLIMATNEYCAAIGAGAAMVQAEESDSEAVEFYRSTRAAELNAIHFEYTFTG